MDAGLLGDARLENTMRVHRDRLGLSQLALAELVGVSRQAIVAIEGGRQIPSTSLGLRLARALRCGVEELFRLSADEGLTVRLAPAESRASGAGPVLGGERVAVGEVGGRWVAHGLPPDPTLSADGIVAPGISGRTAVVRPLADPDQLRCNVLVSGCAPILGALVQRVGRRFADARATWLPGSSRRSLEQLADGLVHVAGVHFSGAGEDNVAAVRRRFPGRRMLVVNLTRWRQGFVVPQDNPLDVRSADAILRPGLRLALREEGASAHKLLMSLLAREGAQDVVLRGPFAAGHGEVAQLVRAGAADVGVAIESVALAAGLGFVPLTEERFDLVLPAEAAGSPPVARLIEALEDPSFRAEIAQLPGYDQEISGHVTTLDAA
jgi:molybdate-binding protein/DNA-binding XRE family transcriptional regulator